MRLQSENPGALLLSPALTASPGRRASTGLLTDAVHMAAGRGRRGGGSARGVLWFCPSPPSGVAREFVKRSFGMESVGEQRHGQRHSGFVEARTYEGIGRGGPPVGSFAAERRGGVDLSEGCTGQREAFHVCSICYSRSNNYIQCMQAAEWRCSCVHGGDLGRPMGVTEHSA